MRQKNTNMNTAHRHNETTQSVYGHTNTISELASPRIAVLIVMNALMKRSKRTSCKYLKGRFQKSEYEKNSFAIKSSLDFDHTYSKSLKITSIANKNTHTNVINTDL